VKWDAGIHHRHQQHGTGTARRAHRGGRILHPDLGGKQECIETVSTYVMDGWAIAADPHTPIGWLAALTAETACVPFVNLTRITRDEPRPQPAPSSVGG
jgi:hypothetical protein